MAPDEPSGSRPAPVVLRIKLRYDDVEAMVQRFAPNVGKSGLFLPTKSLQAVGAEVKFELRLVDDTPVLVGLGRVKAAKAPDPANPKAAFGMALEFMRVTRESRDVIMKMLERRKALGLPELAIPLPADIDAARRAEIDTATKDAPATAVPTAPAPMIDSAPVLTTTLNPDSGPVMTAPRRTSGPIAIAKLSAAVAALEPEAPRKKRAPVSEVIERASGPIASAVTVPGLDDDVDVGAVIARARTLAGGNLDAELDALREMSAAPIEIGIEAASAELAKQLGGAPVTRDRSARWATPPSTISAPVEAKTVVPPVDVPPVEATTAAPPVEAKAEKPAARTREPTRPPEPVEARTVIAPVPRMREPTKQPLSAMLPPVEAPLVEAPDEVEPLLRRREPTRQPLSAMLPPIELRDSTPILDVEPDPEDEEAHEVEADQIADEIHQLGDGDVEEVEHTQIGVIPDDPAAFEQHVFATEPGVNADLERSLDQHLADAEAEADELGLARREDGVAEAEEEIDDFEILAEADAEDADLMSAHGEQEASGAHPVVARPASEPEHTPLPAPIPAPHDDSPDENRHVPARIRAHQRRVSSQHPIVRSSPALIVPEPEDNDGHEADFSIGSELTPDPRGRAPSDFSPAPS